MSTVPAALSGLVTATRVAVSTLPEPMVRVDDGPWLNRPEEQDVVVIGWTPDEGEAVEFTDAIAGLGSSQETYTITCLASSWSGEVDMAARRARVDAIVEAIRAELKTDRTLGGVVTRARLAAWSLDQYQTSQGCEATETFVVAVDAFRVP